MFSALFVAFIQKRQVQFLDQHDAAVDERSLTDKNDKALSNRQQDYIMQQNFNSEIPMMILSPWVCYLIADGLQLSGIVAILTNGLFLN